MASRWRGWFSVVLCAAAWSITSGCGPDRVGDGDGANDGGDDGAVDWSACAVPSDCELAANDCCGTCNVPSLGDFDAINRQQQDAHFADVCPDADPICPGCASAPNPWLTATCETKVCAGVDLSTHPLNTCNADADCRLRSPTCCECGAATDIWSVIAVPVQAEDQLAALLCDPDIGCPECAPAYPTELTAICRDGRCDVDGR